MIPPALVQAVPAATVRESTRAATKVIQQELHRRYPGNQARRLCAKLSPPRWTSTEAEDFHRWFETAMVREQSAGNAALLFAQAVLAIVADHRVLDSRQRESITKICATVRAKRPLPSRHWADFVEAQLDNPVFVASILACCLHTTTRIEDKIAAEVRRHSALFGQRVDVPLMIFGYSATLVAAIRGIAGPLRRRLDVLTPVQSLKNRDAPDGHLLRDKIADSVRSVNVLENDDACRILSAGQASLLLMGCKIIGRRRQGRIEIVNSKHARRFALAAARGGVPLAVVTGSYKLWPTSIYEQHRAEIIADTEANSIIGDHQVRWIVTEDGIADRATLVNYDDYFTVNGIPVASVREGLAVSRLPNREFSANVREMSALARLIGALGAADPERMTPAGIARTAGLPRAHVRTLLHKHLGNFIDQTYEALIELARRTPGESTEELYQSEFARLRRLQQMEAGLIDAATRAELQPLKAGLKILRDYEGRV